MSNTSELAPIGDLSEHLPFKCENSKSADGSSTLTLTYDPVAAFYAAIDDATDRILDNWGIIQKQKGFIPDGTVYTLQGISEGPGKLVQEKWDAPSNESSDCTTNKLDKQSVEFFGKKVLGIGTSVWYWKRIGKQDYHVKVTREEDDANGKVLRYEQIDTLKSDDETTLLQDCRWQDFLSEVKDAVQASFAMTKSQA